MLGCFNASVQLYCGSVIDLWVSKLTGRERVLRATKLALEDGLSYTGFMTEVHLLQGAVGDTSR